MLIPFDADHLARLDFKPAAAAIMAIPGALERLNDLAFRGFCETILTEDRKEFLGVVAAIPTSSGSCEVLVMGSAAQDRFPIAFAKNVRRILDVARQHFGSIRAIGEDTPFLRRWFGWLGFACRGEVAETPFYAGRKMLMWELGSVA